MAAYLEQVELFAGVEPAQLDALAAAAQLRVFPRGAIVVHAGDEGRGLFVVQRGALKVFLMDEGGRQLTLSIHGPGEHFGERVGGGHVAIEPDRIVIRRKLPARC